MKNLFTTVLLLLIMVASYAQKSSKKTFVVQLIIDPTTPKPENPITYATVLNTPLDPLSTEEEFAAGYGIDDPVKKAEAITKARNAKLNDLKNEYLSIRTERYNKNDTNPMWTLSLVTSDVKTTFVNEKSIPDLSSEDVVFSYKYSASLSIKDNLGKVIWEKVLVNGNDEQKMTKRMLVLNTVYKAKIQLYQNDPKKLKKFSDEFLQKKSNLILEGILVMARKAIADMYEIQTKDFNVAIFSVKGKAYEELNQTSEKIFEAYKKFRALSKKNRISKEEMNQVMRDALVVWDNYIARKSELEEKAGKGLLLNGALAYAWLGEFDKAAGYLDQVSEAKIGLEDVEDADTEDGPPSPMGATVFLSFPKYAANMRGLFDTLNEYRTRVTIVQ